MPRATIGALLQELFAPTLDGTPKPPMILLVHGERMMRCVLRSFGVDTSQWKVGIKELLYFPGARTSPRRDSYYYDNKHDVRNYTGRWKRERSRSPRRQDAVTDYTPRPRSPPRAHAPPTVYVVDVRQMYQTVMQVPRSDSILSHAIEFAVRDTAPVRGADDEIIYQDVDPQSWCAGRESRHVNSSYEPDRYADDADRLIGYVWEDMANSFAIDEQRAFRHKFTEEEPIEGYPYASGAAGGDDDVDPNDIVPNASRVGNNAPAPKPVGMYDSASEDDDW